METNFESFHDEVQFSTNSLLSNDEMMKDQLRMLESIKNEGNVLWAEESVMNEAPVGKEDFQQIMSDWQNHVGSLQISESEDVDVPLDLLSTSDVIFDERRSPVLSKALNYSVPKLENTMQSASELLGVKKEPAFESDSCESYVKSQNEPRFYSAKSKSEPTIVRKLTLLNGEKEILGKNIIGLHSLNEIKENPDENCQITSTVINGKRYKIIIKPKTQKVKKFTEEKIRKTLIQKLTRCNIVSKPEPKEDGIISEMCNGNYDVPILGNDTLLNWDMTFDSSVWDYTTESDLPSDDRAANDAEPPKKVPPLKIKIPKMKKGKKKKAVAKADEEIDVETVGERAKKGKKTNSESVENPKDKAPPPPAKEQEKDKKVDEAEDQKVGEAENRKVDEAENKKVDKAEEKKVDEAEKKNVEKVEKKKVEKAVSSNEVIKKSLPREVVDQIESLKRKKDGRIPLVQVLPTKKHVRSGMRMQDAAATINRNKLLKIVSGGDTVQLDHDYCTNTLKKGDAPQKKSGNSDLEANLAEKNPKKDSGMESGDVSDASEEPQTPENVPNIQSIHHINHKLLQERRMGKTRSITKVAAAFFRAANVITSNSNANNSDIVKTLVVSNGTKALTNDPAHPANPCKADSDKSDTVPSGSEKSNSGDGSKKADGNGDKPCSEQAQRSSQIECPKKKLKLEEYLSRRNGKKAETKKDPPLNEHKEVASAGPVAVEKRDPAKAPETTEAKREKKDEKQDNTKEKSGERSRRESSSGGRGGSRKSRQYRSPRSSSTSSGERESRRERERSSRSRSSWRGNKRESRSRRKYRESTSSERRRRFWSRSLSRSSSRESSSSSDRSTGRRKRTPSPGWYRQRSRSRTMSRERSRSRNRSYSNRRRQNRYFNRNFYNRRSRSPYYNYVNREKQRQIEERRVIYIGRIEEGMTNAKLRERFSVFGPIVDISLHFREYGDNYGFVTYAYKDDAYDAVEHGNDNPNLPHYDLCFGGRRGFCKERYADLDGMPTSYSGFKDTPALRPSEESFDLLLKEAQAKLKKRISKGEKS